MFQPSLSDFSGSSMLISHGFSRVFLCFFQLSFFWVQATDRQLTGISQQRFSTLATKWPKLKIKAGGLEGSYLPSGKLLHNYGKIHHFSWENLLFLWSFSIATFNYQRVKKKLLPTMSNSSACACLWDISLQFFLLWKAALKVVMKQQNQEPIWSKNTSWFTVTDHCFW